MSAAREADATRQAKDKVEAIMQDHTTSGLPNSAAAYPSSPDQDRDTNTDIPVAHEQAKATPEPEAAGSSLAGQAKQRLAGTMDTQKGTAADFVEQLAQTVQKSGQQFEGQQDWIASAIGRGAAELNTLAGSLRSKDVSELAREVQLFAGRQPALFIAATVVAGFATARIGKMVASDMSRDDLPTLPEVGNGQH
jgi:hypothetical protein